MRNRLLLAAIMLVTLGAMTTAPVAADEGPAIVPPGTSVYGSSYGTWAQRYFEWLWGSPDAQSPITHPRNCASAQHGAVYFVAHSSFGERRSTHCSIARGTPILLTAGGVSSDGSDTPGNLRALKSSVELQFAKLFNPRVWVDGVEVANVEQYVVTTAPWRLRYLPGNIFDVPPATYQAVAAGWFLMLKPLPAGRHVVTVRDEQEEEGIAQFSAYLTVR